MIGYETAPSPSADSRGQGGRGLKGDGGRFARLDRVAKLASTASSGSTHGQAGPTCRSSSRLDRPWVLVPPRHPTGRGMALAGRRATRSCRCVRVLALGALFIVLPSRLDRLTASLSSQPAKLPMRLVSDHCCMSGRDVPRFGERVVSWETIWDKLFPEDAGDPHDDVAAAEMHRLRGLVMAQGAETEAVLGAIVKCLDPTADIERRTAGQLLRDVRRLLKVVS